MDTPSRPAGRVRAALIDDSAIVRKHLAELLVRGGIEVVCTAQDPLFAWDKMASLAGGWPDVIVLDVEMPRMDGLTFLHKLMVERPTPVVMCSTLTEAGCATTLQALAAGAVSFVTKPKLGLRDFLEDRSNGLVDAVRAAARANVRAAVARPAGPAPLARGTAALPAALPPAGPATAMAETTDRVIAIGSSTGGVQTLEALLRELPRTTPGIMIVQHMPERFTQAFAARLNQLVPMEVKEAAHGDRLVTGRVLIAPGGRHLRLKRSGAHYVAEVSDGPLVNRHKPSVDVLFRSVAECAGANAIGALLTGMGDDGARGLLEMRRAGARTAAQDEASCVVFGMPAAAVNIGAADDVVSLAGLPRWLLDRAAERVRAPAAG
ncbi:MAG: chemotaxis response regulator protein-glutamate methylesterase [Rubrivivax sp.]|nr:chemotaxis response regulator protein-glutamate methylesterase [Rubrivivax sp.]